MTFASRITCHPIPYAPHRGGDAWAALPDAPPALRDLITGAAGCSPYLARLIEAEASWLAPALHHTPEDELTKIIAATRDLNGDALNTGLRHLKRRAALIVALADLGGIWDLPTITQTWTDFADACLAAALSHHVAAQAKRGAIPGMGQEDAFHDGCGMVGLAMGKMGGEELNYSSDIDLIMVFDETRFDPADEPTARAGFIKATRAISATLSDVTSDGYVFRTDLRLRPDPSVTPVCLSMAAAERYYESEGRTWERSAFIKARPAAGDIKAGHQFLTRLTPFIWRRQLDFAMIQDTLDMRQKLRDHKGLHSGGHITLEGHNMKLGTGGIRDIEFYAQTRQLVAGGRDKTLRSRRTVQALVDLARAGWITHKAATDLGDHYAYHRKIEHRLQMLEDAQTHSLPKTDDGFDRLARFCGLSDTAMLRAQLQARLTAVNDLTSDFFAAPKQAAPPAPIAQDQAELAARWPHYPALRSSRAQVIFDRLKPDLLRRFQSALRPTEALSNFDRFLRGLPAGVQLFSLFEANPALVDLIVDICATAPGLSQYLSRQPGVLDAVLDGRFFAPWPGVQTLTHDLTTTIGGLDYEAQLDATRRWQKDWHFRIGVHHLRGLITPHDAAIQYSDLADAVLAGLWPCVCDEIARRHGPAPGRGGVVIGMGSLGAKAMTARSDLDLIVIYDADGVETSNGARPLETRRWYAKATKGLITALTAPTAAGKLYDADLRLRPSGQQGPVATSLTAFRTYQAHEAWTWEHMALTRARAVAGPQDLQTAFENARHAVLSHPHSHHKVLADLRDMRARLQMAEHATDIWAIKDGAGGLKDLDLLAQATGLMANATDRTTPLQLAAAAQAGLLDDRICKALIAAQMLYVTVMQSGFLVAEGRLSPDMLGEQGGRFLAQQAGLADVKALASQLGQTRSQIAHIIDEICATAS